MAAATKRATAARTMKPRGKSKMTAKKPTARRTMTKARKR